MTQQLHQDLRIHRLDDMIGNTDALSVLRTISDGFVLIEGPMGCGKTSAALAHAAALTGVQIEESQTQYIAKQRRFLSHYHAQDLDINFLASDGGPLGFFKPGVHIIDEAQVLTAKRQQSRLKTIRLQPDTLLMFCTTNPGALDPAIRDRCAIIRLGPLTPREVPALVKRACQHTGVHYSDNIVAALNRADHRRPRQILNTIDDLMRGKPLLQAVADNL